MNQFLRHKIRGAPSVAQVHSYKPAWGKKRIINRVVSNGVSKLLVFMTARLLRDPKKIAFTYDRMHKWRPKMYSFVYVLMRLTSLALKQHFFCILSIQTRLVRLIST